MSESNNKYIKNLIAKPTDNLSVMQRIGLLSPKEQSQVLEDIRAQIGEERFKKIEYEWEFWRRPDQCLMPDEERTKWKVFFFLCGRGYGKAADLNTLIPTVTGFTTMGDIKVGDEVFDEQGKVCRVTGVTDVFMPEKAYRLHFSDGATLDVCSEHRFVTFDRAARHAYRKYNANDEELMNSFPKDWITWRRKSRDKKGIISKEAFEKIQELKSQGYTASKIYKKFNKTYTLFKKAYNCNSYEEYLNAGIHLSSRYDDDRFPKTVTTQEIIDTFTYKTGNREDLNHCIPNTFPIELPEKELPISPYLYGVWLGDGTSIDGTITQGLGDYKELKLILEDEGFVVGEFDEKNIRFKIQGLSLLLAKYGLKGNKRIIPEYLRASVSQRLALVQGLMDTDGHIHHTHKHCEFVNTNKNIADAMLELLCSLGQKPVMVEKQPTLNGVDKKLAYRITFRPTIQVFRLPRKASQVQLKGRQMLSNHHRMITRYEEIPPVPMKCIQVDSPNSMYLITKHFIPTSNTRTGAETVKEYIKKGWAKKIALIGPTTDDVNNTMIAGGSGILSVFPDDEKPEWNKNNKTLYFKNGALVRGFSSEAPERLRGPAFDFVWADELCSWRHEETWDMMQMCLRDGEHPQVIVTTTPKFSPLLKRILGADDTYVRTGSSYDNVGNMASSFFETISNKYEGTTLGRQELYAEIIDLSTGILWNEQIIDQNRFRTFIQTTEGDFEQLDLPDFSRIVVAVDPAVTSNKDSAQTGITVVAEDFSGHYYVLESFGIQKSPKEIAVEVSDIYDKYNANCVVVEVNNGGDWIKTVLQEVRSNLPVKEVHATRGKVTRAEPIVTLYEQGKVHHVGVFKDLEQQMIDLNPAKTKKSLKDLVDSLVWGLTFLSDRSSYISRGIPIASAGGYREQLKYFKKRPLYLK